MSLTVFVTGATAGFGAAITRRFVRDGHRVIAAGRRADRLDALRAELGDAVLPFPLDVTDGPAAGALPGSLPAGWQGVDVLVNNAGLALGVAPAQQASLADWDTMVATNITGLIRLTHALLPGMVARDRGHVVNISSTAASFPYPGGNVYGASKAFVTHFSANLKADLVGTGVRVTDVETRPGRRQRVSARSGSAATRTRPLRSMPAPRPCRRRTLPRPSLGSWRCRPM